jgi:dTMP kinase
MLMGHKTPAFFVLEGLDGVGKTSQFMLLSEELRNEGLSVLAEAEPTGLPSGRLLRSVLSGTQEHGHLRQADTLRALFAADRAAHIEHVAKKISESNTDIILFDRYIPSSLAYQWDVAGDEAGFLATLTANALFPLPDITFYLHAPLTVLRARIDARNTSRTGQSLTDFTEAESRLTETARRYKRAEEALASIKHQWISIDATRDRPYITQELKGHIIQWRRSQQSSEGTAPTR